MDASAEPLLSAMTLNKHRGPPIECTTAPMSKTYQQCPVCLPQKDLFPCFKSIIVSSENLIFPKTELRLNLYSTYRDASSSLERRMQVLSPGVTTRPSRTTCVRGSVRRARARASSLQAPLDERSTASPPSWAHPSMSHSSASCTPQLLSASTSRRYEWSSPLSTRCSA